MTSNVSIVSDFVANGQQIILEKKINGGITNRIILYVGNGTSFLQLVAR